MSHVAERVTEGDLQRVEVEEDAVSRPSRRGLIQCLQKVALGSKERRVDRTERDDAVESDNFS